MTFWKNFPERPERFPPQALLLRVEDGSGNCPAAVWRTLPKKHHRGEPGETVRRPLLKYGAAARGWDSESGAALWLRLGKGSLRKAKKRLRKIYAPYEESDAGVRTMIRFLKKRSFFKNAAERISEIWSVPKRAVFQAMEPTYENRAKRWSKCRSFVLSGRLGTAYVDLQSAVLLILNENNLNK